MKQHKSPLEKRNDYAGYHEIYEIWDEWCIMATDGDCTDVHYEFGEQLLAKWMGLA